MFPSNSIVNLQNIALHQGDEIYNIRTKQNIKALYNTSLMYYDDLNKFSNTNFFIMPEGRCVFPHIAAAELCWALTGEKNIGLIKKYSSMWDKFSNEKGEVEAAYGYRMRRHFGRDQLFELIDLLNKDKSTRQGLVSYWDFMFYDQLALALSNELSLKKKNVVIFSANSHLYTEHENIVMQQLMLDEHIFLPKYYSTNFTLSEIMIDPEGYVEEIRGLCAPDVEKRRDIFNPKPEVFE
jgi:thymidylate synthase